MLGSSTTLDAAQIRALLSRVGAIALRKRIELELIVLGGAAIALLFDARRVTRDIDIVDRADAVLVASHLGLARSSTELAIAPYLAPNRYIRACEELEDIWPEVEDARG